MKARICPEPAWRKTGAFSMGLRLGFAKARRIELGIHLNLIHGDSLHGNRSIPEPGGAGHRKNPRLQNKRNRQAVYLPVIAEADFHTVTGVIEPPGRSFRFRFPQPAGADFAAA